MNTKYENEKLCMAGVCAALHADGNGRTSDKSGRGAAFSTIRMKGEGLGNGVRPFQSNQFDRLSPQGNEVAGFNTRKCRRSSDCDQELY